MTGIMDGGVGAWAQTGRDAMHVGRDYVRAVTVLDADSPPDPLDLSWVAEYRAEIRTGRPSDPTPGALIATAQVAPQTDGSDGVLIYRVAAGQLAPLEARTDLRHDVVAIDAVGNRYQLIAGPTHVRQTATELAQ